MERFDPLRPDVLQNPYRHYAAYREQEPVHWGRPGDAGTPGTWYLFRHDDVVAALKDPRLGREVRGVKPEAAPPPLAEEFKPLQAMMDSWIILRDPPTHTRLRGLVNKAFVPRVVERLLPRIAQEADMLLDAAQAHGRIELIGDFARVLPVLAIADALGVPAQDHALFLPWAVALAQMIEFKQTDEVRRNGLGAMLAMLDYLRSLIAERRREPREDLITGLIQAEEDGGKLTEDEMLGSITMLLTAGNDPTQHMIGNAVLALLQQPEQMAFLCAQLRIRPALIETATDELLRYDSSVQATFRYALEDVVYSGQRIRTGEHMALLFGSALRDPTHCANPDTLDLTRENNRLPFGFGPHFCLGMAMARALGQMALQKIVSRWPNLALETHQLEWEPRLAVRGVKALPLVWG